MKINLNTNTVFCANAAISRKLVPLKNYQGPLLKLTKEDESKIKMLQGRIITLELEHFSFSKYIACAKTVGINTLEKLWDIEHTIWVLNEEIKNIKRRRFNAQKEQVSAE